jgi:hypothetical protein
MIHHLVPYDVRCTPVMEGVRGDTHQYLTNWLTIVPALLY